MISSNEPPDLQTLSDAHTWVDQRCTVCGVGQRTMGATMSGCAALLKKEYLKKEQPFFRITGTITEVE